MTKPPKSAIIKAHKLADELLALWQQDVRPWVEQEKTEFVAFSVNRELQAVTTWFRELRREVEQ